MDFFTKHTQDYIIFIHYLLDIYKLFNIIFIHYLWDKYLKKYKKNIKKI
jgi:hypothetical protein